MIKNSNYVHVLVIYTGKDAKVMMNQGKYKNKKSKIEKQLNIVIFGNIILLFCLDGLMSGLNYKWINDNAEKAWYLWPKISPSVQKVASKATVKTIGSYYLLFN